MPLIIATCPTCSAEVTAVVCPTRGHQYARPCDHEVVATVELDRIVLEAAQ